MSACSSPRIILLVLFLTGFVACSSSPRTSAEKTIRRVGPPRLRSDAALLYKDAFAGRTTDFLLVSKSLWPKSFLAFSPVRVGAYRDGIAVVLQATGDAESGIFVIPAGMEHAPRPAPRFQLSPVSDGVYWYELNP